MLLLVCGANYCHAGLYILSLFDHIVFARLSIVDSLVSLLALPEMSYNNVDVMK